MRSHQKSYKRILCFSVMYLRPGRLDRVENCQMLRKLQRGTVIGKGVRLEPSVERRESRKTKVTHSFSGRLDSQVTFNDRSWYVS